MARKETISKLDILSAAFEMTKEEGLDKVTARRLATKIGCSTQPIFRVYKSMEDLYDEVYEQAVEFYNIFFTQFESVSKTPFVNLGMAYLEFASTHPKLFQLLFLDKSVQGKSLYELLNGNAQSLTQEITNTANDGAKDPQRVFMKMWIFIHGSACMIITKEFDLTREQSIDLLEETYFSFKE